MARGLPALLYRERLGTRASVAGLVSVLVLVLPAIAVALGTD